MKTCCQCQEPIEQDDDFPNSGNVCADCQDNLDYSELEDQLNQLLEEQ